MPELLVIFQTSPGETDFLGRGTSSSLFWSTFMLYKEINSVLPTPPRWVLLWLTGALSISRGSESGSCPSQPQDCGYF